MVCLLFPPCVHSHCIWDGGWSLRSPPCRQEEGDSAVPLNNSTHLDLPWLPWTGMTMGRGSVVSEQERWAFCQWEGCDVLWREGELCIFQRWSPQYLLLPYNTILNTSAGRSRVCSLSLSSGWWMTHGRNKARSWMLIKHLVWFLWVLSFKARHSALKPEQPHGRAPCGSPANGRHWPAGTQIGSLGRTPIS